MVIDGQIVKKNVTPKCEWDANTVLQRYEHDIINSTIGNEYKTIGLKPQRGPTGGAVNLDALKGQVK